MALPDNRIRFQPTKLDLAAQVGLTGQDHDSYPAPGSQARYDWMQLYLIGLLSQQSSYDEPTQKRDGTPWFDLNDLTLKIWKMNAWMPYSDAIPLTSLDGTITLNEWFSSVESTLSNLAPELFYGGICGANGISDIPIPTQLQPHIYPDSRAFVTVNGVQIDPREVQFIGSPASTVRLSTIELEINDSFTVLIKRIPASTFISSNISVP